MSRERLTTRTAADMKSKPGAQVVDKGSGIANDPYDMNDTGHSKNDPAIGEYAKGDSETWNEGVNKDNPAKDDQKREETGHAPLIDKHAATEAIASARRLEEKAVKAIIASQRMLPGATDAIIEKQAGILMHLPEDGLNATLSNQESLAMMIAKAAGESAEEKDEDEEAKEKSEKDASDDKDKDDDKEKSDKEAGQNDPHAFDLKKKKEKLASLKKAAEDLEKEVKEDEEKDASADSDEDDKEEKDASADAKKDEEEVEASDSSLLDQIFSGVMPSPIKKGASKLSGMVKKEASSSGSNDLSSLWSSAPDVSSIF